VIPKCLEYLRNHMEVQGIFRISGTRDEVESLKSSFDSGLDADFNKCKDPHAVSNLLKQYLRELPNPLLTYERYDTFVQIAKEKEENKKKQLITVLGLLPPTNRNTLKLLLEFLHEVSKKSDINKMTALNLATVFGPTFLRAHEETLATAGNNDLINPLTELMIKDPFSLFPQGTQTPVQIHTPPQTLPTTQTPPIPQVRKFSTPVAVSPAQPSSGSFLLQDSDPDRPTRKGIVIPPGGPMPGIILNQNDLTGRLKTRSMPFPDKAPVQMVEPPKVQLRSVQPTQQNRPQPVPPTSGSGRPALKPVARQSGSPAITPKASPAPVKKDPVELNQSGEEEPAPSYEEATADDQKTNEILPPLPELSQMSMITGSALPPPVVAPPVVAPTVAKSQSEIIEDLLKNLEGQQSKNEDLTRKIWKFLNR